eukprot:296192-Amphidinium_carterae.1
MKPVLRRLIESIETELSTLKSSRERSIACFLCWKSAHAWCGCPSPKACAVTPSPHVIRFCDARRYYVQSTLRLHFTESQASRSSEPLLVRSDFGFLNHTSLTTPLARQLGRTAGQRSPLVAAEASQLQLYHQYQNDYRPT